MPGEKNALGGEEARFAEQPEQPEQPALVSSGLVTGMWSNRPTTGTTKGPTGTTKNNQNYHSFFLKRLIIKGGCSGCSGCSHFSGCAARCPFFPRKSASGQGMARKAATGKGLRSSLVLGSHAHQKGAGSDSFTGSLKWFGERVGPLLTGAGVSWLWPLLPPSSHPLSRCRFTPSIL